VFHSEADFQHALAWVAHRCEPNLRVRLETRLGPRTRLDLLLSRPDVGTNFAIELKYLTAGWTGSWDGEQFQLLNQGAQDISAYDVVKDIQRVERFVDNRLGWTGAVVVLTNDPSYWKQPGHTRQTNAHAFRIYDSNQLVGVRAWGPNTGEGTRKGRDVDLDLWGEYVCHWSDYSQLEDPRGRFRLLTFTVGG
jgi:hypothetical protein